MLITSLHRGSIRPNLLDVEKRKQRVKFRYQELLAPLLITQLLFTIMIFKRGQLQYLSHPGLVHQSQTRGLLLSYFSFLT